MKKLLNTRIKIVLTGMTLVATSSLALVAYATHSWGNYHWARTANPFTLQLGNNLSSLWTAHLAAASADWSVATVLDTTVVSGLSNTSCKATKGRVEVCNNRYGNNGWLGVAQIWASGDHITQGTVKVNDTYFNTPKYNTLAWRQFVTCQEIGHTLGLDHQNEIPSDPNLGTCMDYTNDPDGTLFSQLDNKHPNQHDYDQLATIYSHADGFATLVKKTAALLTNNDNVGDDENSPEWGRAVRKSKNGHHALYERDLGKGDKIFTFVIWAE